MNKQNLPYFTAIMLAVLIIAPCIAGAHILQNTFQNITVAEAHKMIEKDAFVPANKLFILDVRSPAEYKYGYIEGAVSMPVNKNSTLHDPVDVPDEDMLAWHIEKHKGLPENKNTKIIVYCKSGTRSVKASKMLADAGYRKVYNMQGGIDAWVNTSYPVIFNNIKWAGYYPTAPKPV